MKNTYIVIGAVLAILLVAVLVILMKKEKAVIASSNEKEMSTLINNYSTITDTSTKKMIWMHILKTCKVQNDEAIRQAKKWGRTLAAQYDVSVQYLIDNGRDPVNYISKCDPDGIGNKTYCEELKKKILALHPILDIAERTKSRKILSQSCS